MRPARRRWRPGGGRRSESAVAGGGRPARGNRSPEPHGRDVAGSPTRNAWPGPAHFPLPLCGHPIGQVPAALSVADLAPCPSSAPPSRSSSKPPLLTLSLPACAAPYLRAGSTMGRRTLWPRFRFAGSWISEGLATGSQQCNAIVQQRHGP